MSPVIQFFEGSKPDHTKNWLYGLCSLSYLGAMVSSNSALQYVNYPTQVSPVLSVVQSQSV